MINEGVDIPIIDNIIIACGGGRTPIQTIQSAGRVLRKHGNKIKSIIDFYDVGKFVGEHSRCRKEVYESFGIVEIVRDE